MSTVSTRFAAFLTGMACALGLAPAPAAAQELLCCNHLVSFGGDWFGALRQCSQKLESASLAQRRKVCEQLKGDVCAEVAPYCQVCKGDEAKKKDSGGTYMGPGDPLFDGVVDGARSAGIAGFGPEHVVVQDRREKTARLFFTIRVDGAGCPLPNGDCIISANESGQVPPNKQVGAKLMLFGSVQFAGEVVRANGRYVNVETGVIQDAAVGPTIPGNDRAAIAKAVGEMLAKLGLRCQKARGLEY